MVLRADHMQTRHFPAEDEGDEPAQERQRAGAGQNRGPLPYSQEQVQSFLAQLLQQAGYADTKAPATYTEELRLDDVRTPTRLLPPAAQRERLRPERVPRAQAMARARRVREQTLFQKLGMTAALLFAAFVIFKLWQVGAFFTLYFLEAIPFLKTIGFDIAAMGPYKWGIPVGITLIQIFFWPRHEGWGGLKELLLFWWPAPGTDFRKHIAFLLGLLFDIGNTCGGVMLYFSGASVALYAGITMPTGGTSLIIIGIALGFVCASAPERFGRWIFRDLWSMWVPYGSWLDRTGQQLGLVR